MSVNLKYDRDICVCPQCGLKRRHRVGFPCFRELCPDCKIPMERQAGNLKMHTPLEIEAMQQPLVDDHRCIACGICLDVCPVQAIRFRNGKAWIDPAHCTACGNCINHCPQVAIVQAKLG